MRIRAPKLRFFWGGCSIHLRRLAPGSSTHVGYDLLLLAGPDPVPADGNPKSSTPMSPVDVDGSLAAAKCGIVIIGHGSTATTLLEAARQLIPGDGLADVIAIDAGTGRTPELEARVLAAVEQVDEGQGILLIADLMGSSPCMCGMRESAGHGLAVVTGLNLAMLAKLATLDRQTTPRELAEACADSVGRSICVKIRDTQTA
jgi:PTS system mannose-specific IIA component